MGIGLKHRPLTKTKTGSHSSYVKHQEDFERLHYMKPCKTCNPCQPIRPYRYNLPLLVKAYWIKLHAKLGSPRLYG